MLKKCLVLIAFCVSPAVSQVIPRYILAGKYSADVVKESLTPKEQWRPYPQTPAEWKAKVPQKELDDLVRAGEKAREKPIAPISGSLLLEYVRTGERVNHSNASFGRRGQLMELVLAESVEDKGRFTEAIVNSVWAICEETYWGVPAHLSVQKAKNGLPDADDPTVDLFGAETAAVLALTDYLVGEKLDKISPLLRKRIYSETKNKIFDPIQDASRYNWLNKKRQVNNWNPWIVSNLLTANLLLEKDEKLRSAAVHRYMVYLDYYLNSNGDDGGCDEGPSYWFAAGACVFDCLETLKSASGGKLDIFNEPLIKNIAGYVYKVHIADDYFVNFADADPKLQPDGLMLYRFSKEVDDPQLRNFGQWAYKKFGSATGGSGNFRARRIENLLTVNEIAKDSGASFQPIKNAWFSDIQVLTARASNGLYLATHAGHNAESHNHNDVGDFIVYADGEPVIIDAGRGNYTARTFSSKRYDLWFTQSQFHNLPAVNGSGQMAGRNYNARNVKSLITDKEASLTMDIAPAYDKNAGIQTWNRKVGLNMIKKVIEITDDYVLAANPDTLIQVFMTVCEVDIQTAGKINFITPGKKNISLNYDAKKWSVSSDLPSTEGMEYSSFKTKWDGRAVKRIILTGKSARAKDKHSFVISRKE